MIVVAVILSLSDRSLILIDLYFSKRSKGLRELCKSQLT